MTRRKRDQLRQLSEDERHWLECISRSQGEPSSHVVRAKQLLAVADGFSYQAAAQSAGIKSGDTTSSLVRRFNQVGLEALQPRHGGGSEIKYRLSERERILKEFRRQPVPEIDGTATWSLKTLRAALHKASDGLPEVSEDTLRTVLLENGYSWQQSRSWCETGTAVRKRKRGKKNIIELAYQTAEKTGLALWNQDEAGPYQTIPYSGQSWEPESHPALQPHEYVRNGVAKILTLFHPASGLVRVKGVTSSANVVLHPWLKEQLTEILAALPEKPVLTPEANRAVWLAWQKGLSMPINLPEDLPLLRMLMIWDNLRGHYTTEMLLWLFQHGILPVFTPIGGSWLNMAESMQRILVQRALSGQQPETPEKIMTLLEGVAQGWNLDPTPFEWGGKRAARRQRSRARRHALGGSGACVRRPIPRNKNLLQKWQESRQPTH